MNELPSEAPILQPLQPQQFLAQQDPGEFHLCLDVVNNDPEDFEPTQKSISYYGQVKAINKLYNLLPKK